MDIYKSGQNLYSICFICLPEIIMRNFQSNIQKLYSIKEVHILIEYQLLAYIISVILVRQFSKSQICSIMIVIVLCSQSFVDYLKISCKLPIINAMIQTYLVTSLALKWHIFSLQFNFHQNVLPRNLWLSNLQRLQNSSGLSKVAIALRSL